MRMFTRIQALALAVVMLLTMLPAAAAADEVIMHEGESDGFTIVVPDSITPPDVPVEEPVAPAETTPAPTAEPTPVPTAVPVEESRGDADDSNEVFISSPDEIGPRFVAGLARLASGAKLFKHKYLSGDYQETSARGVVYALEQTDDGRAIRVTFNNEGSVYTGWVRSVSVTMMSESQAAEYDKQDFSRKETIEVRGHRMTSIPFFVEEPEEVYIPDDALENLVPVVPAAPVVPDVPADDAADLNEEEAGTRSEEQETAAEETTEETFEEVFVAEIPEPTMADLPEPSIAPEHGEELERLVVHKALNIPTGLSATHTRLGVMTLRWNAVAGADGYTILYKPVNGSSYTVLGTSTTNSFTTSSLDPSIVYYFRVQAVTYASNGSVLNASPHSESYPYIVLGDAKLEDPRGKDTSTIRLNWSAVAGATHYDVIMSIHGQNNWKTVRTDLTGNLCDIANISFDETYDFRVIPKRKLNNGVVITGNSSRVAMVGSPMETPSFQNYEWTSTGLKLTWDAIPGASGYVIYRRAFSETDVTNYTKLVVLTEPVTTYTDTSMKQGEVYYYFVYSYKTCCSTHGWRCFSLKGEIGMGVWLSAATGITCENVTGTGVKLSWTPVTGASHYDVNISSTQGYYPTGNGNGRVSAAGGFHSNPANLNSYYYYRVRPVRVFSNGDVSMGPWSAEVANYYKEKDPVYRALLIGNTYPNETKYLPGCDNDAYAMRSMLSRMTKTPYNITLKLNRTDTDMISDIKTAFGSATSNDVSLFFYSGHGANSTGSTFHGALVGVRETYLTISRLKAALDTIPGKKIVIVDSCHSGQMIGKDASGASKAELNAFNSKIIGAFATDAVAKADTTIVFTDADEVFSAEPMMITRGTNDLANSGYYVITAAHSTQQSVSVGSDTNSDGKADKYFGLFTYGLCLGSGWNEISNKAINSLYADSDANGQITLYEAYLYAKTVALKTNPNQTAQYYPTNSAQVIWAK